MIPFFCGFAVGCYMSYVVFQLHKTKDKDTKKKKAEKL